MNRSFVHLELNTDDIESARSFYATVFGWSFTDVPMGGESYLQIGLPQPPGGGIQLKHGDHLPSHWLPYVGVDDLKTAIVRARKAGARVLEDYIEVPGYGALAIIADPSGASLGLWQPQSEPQPKSQANGAPGKRATPRASTEADEVAQAPAASAAPPARAKQAGGSKKAGRKAAKTSGGAASAANTSGAVPKKPPKKKAAKATGGGAKKTAKATGGGAKKAAKATGGGAKKAAKKAAKATGGAAKKAAKKKTGKGVAKSTAAGAKSTRGKKGTRRRAPTRVHS